MLWPSRLAGPLDGVPLDGRLDALLIGLALPTLLVIDRRALRHIAVRALIVALLIWKAALVVIAVPDGWCVTFTSPRPLFVDGVTVPHTWDVRADWRSQVPRCSAVMTRGYPHTDLFPVWFYNLPPNNFEDQSTAAERPPLSRLAMRVAGALQVRGDGVFRVDTAEGVRLSATIDGRDVTGSELASGLQLAAGAHDVTLIGDLSGDQWRLVPTWNGDSLWHAAVATLVPARAIDLWLRPWGAWLQATLVLALIGLAAWRLAAVIRDGRTALVSLSAALAAVASAASVAAMRMLPVLLAMTAFVRFPRRLHNLRGAQLLIGLPFLVLLAARGYDDIGRAIWYSVGDDWWMFQRYAYRIYLQGYWLEGGEPVFWFQPLYRWIAGALHLLFGDSSVGEMFWDGAFALAGAMFAFRIVRVAVGFQAGLLAAALTLVLFTVGPGWYLFGRGLSEITSAGLIYSAALFAMRGRRDWRWMLAAGVCLAMGVFTRLNNLPFALAVAAFSLPIRQPAGEWWRWRIWWPRCSQHVLWGSVGALVCAALLFGARTYYFTGHFNPLAGTQASARSVWQTSAAGETPIENATNSVLMVITMTDPPRIEPRAVPLVLAIAGSVLGLLGIGRFARLPLNVVLLCLAGIAGAFVARGSAYPGRFSIHLLPLAAALTVCIGALWWPRAARS